MDPAQAGMLPSAPCNYSAHSILPSIILHVFTNYAYGIAFIAFASTLIRSSRAQYASFMAY